MVSLPGGAASGWEVRSPGGIVTVLHRAGYLRGQDHNCAAWVLINGKRARRRTAAERARYAERGGVCGLGCAPNECRVEAEVDPEAEAIYRAWTLCGGRKRFCWPRGGGLEDQRSVVVLSFAQIDHAAAQFEARLASEAQARAR